MKNVSGRPLRNLSCCSFSAFSYTYKDWCVSCPRFGHYRRAGEFAGKLLKPTPIDDEGELSATVVESITNRAVIEATLSYQGEGTFTGRGTSFVVKPGYPAYHQR
jgi:hypothetical protein